MAVHEKPSGRSPRQKKTAQDPRQQESPRPMVSVALTPTGRVIVGMLALGKRSGYDIKQMVDNSTRFFWAASYGQIYPELRKLEQQGLVRGRPEPSGERARTAYELTPAGEAALGNWLSSSDELLDELRDEAMLKLFFSDAAPALRIEIVRAMRDRDQRKLDQLRMIEQKSMPVGPRLTLELGIELTQRAIDWCDAVERRLERSDD